jgi:hypothetical protein
MCMMPGIFLPCHGRNMIEHIIPTDKLYALYYKGQPGMYEPGFCTDRYGVPTIFTKTEGSVIQRHDPLYELRLIKSMQIEFEDHTE